MKGIDGFRFDDQAMLKVALALDDGSVGDCDPNDVHHVIEALMIVAGVVQNSEEGILERLLDARVKRIQVSEIAEQFDCHDEAKAVIDAANNGSRDERISAMIDLAAKADGVSIRKACRIVSEYGYGDPDDLNSRYYRNRKKR